MQKELRRSSKDCMIFGVCGGLAEFFGIDSNIVRLVWAAVSLFAGAGVLLYIIAAFIIPKADPQDQDLQDVIRPGKGASKDNRKDAGMPEDTVDASWKEVKPDEEKDLKDVIHPEGD